MTARASTHVDLDSRDVHTWPLKKLSKKTCLKCCKGGNLLACNDGNCPIVLHESCLPCGARFGNNGKFYCPYCFYKQSRVECSQTKKKAFSAKKTLSNFLDLKMSMENGCTQNSISIKRKEPDSPANNVASRNKIATDEASCQPMQVENGQQDACPELQTQGGDQQEAKPATSNYCWEKGSVSIKSENLNIRPQETLKTSLSYHNVSVGKEQIQAKLQGTAVSLTKKANRRDITEEPIKESESAFRVDISIKTEMAPMSKNAELPAEIGNHCGRTEEGKSLKKSPHRTTNSMMNDPASVVLDESGNLKRQETGTVVKQYNDGGAEKRPNQVLREEISVCLAKEDDKMEMHKESNQGNNCKFQDNCSVRNQMAVNFVDVGKHAAMGVDHFKRENEVQRPVILPEKDVHPMRDTSSATHGESEDGDHSASSQHSCNTGHGNSESKNKRLETLKNANKNGEFVETSEVETSELEEHEEVTHGIRKQRGRTVKKIQDPVLPITRRPKLRWTAEEVEMLEEGVNRFSETTNKNLPWRKILDFGRHVFDGTRRPSDLKDKWKSLMGKRR